MSRELKVLLGVLFGAWALLIAAIPGWIPMWLALTVAALLTGWAVWFLVTRARLKPEPPPLAPVVLPPVPLAPPPPPVPQLRSASLAELPLHSADANFTFLCSAQLSWRPADMAVGQDDNLAALACHMVGQWAAVMARAYAPEHHRAAQVRIGAELGVPRTDPSGRVQIRVDNLQIHLSQDDEQRLRQLTGIDWAQQLWDRQCKFEAARREYLDKDVFESPGSALIWQLAQQPIDVQRSASLISTLDQLALAAQNIRLAPEPASGQFSYPPPPSEPPADVLIEELFPDDGARAMFSAELADLMSRFGQHTEADRVRNQYADMPTPGPAAEPDLADEVLEPSPNGAEPSVSFPEP